MRYAVIDQPFPGSAPANVLSVVETDGDPPPVQDGQSSICDPSAEVAAGWIYVGGLFAAELPRPDFPDISDRQCFQQLANLGKVTQDEALAAVTVGALPKAVTDGIAALPANLQFSAKMLLCGATSFHRAHPMTPVFGLFFGMGSDDLDALWQAAGQL